MKEFHRSIAHVILRFLGTNYNHLRHAGCITRVPSHPLVPHRIHIDAVGVGPGVLEVLLEALAQWVRNLMEADKLPHPEHLCVVAGRARVQPLDDGGHVAEDAGIHEG